MAVSAVLRCGQRIGRGRLIQHLIGEARDALDQDLATLSTYGIGSELSKAGWNRMFDALLFNDFLGEAGDRMRPIIVVPDDETARALFRGDQTMSLREDPASAPERSRSKGKGTPTPVSDLSTEDQKLFEALRTWRTALAKGRGVPPYVIFADKVLVEIARLRPANRDALLQVSGIGEKKADTPN